MLGILRLIKNNFFDVIFPIFLVFSLTFWRFGDGSLNSLWMSRFCILTCILSIFLSFHIPLGRLSFYARASTYPIVLSTLLTGFITSMWFERYNTEAFEIQSTLRQASSFGLSLFLLVSFSVSLLSKKALDLILTSYSLLGLIVGFSIVFSPNPGYQVPFFDNPSMALSFVIMTLPLLPKGFVLNVAGYLVVLIGIVLVKASTPVLVFSGVILGELLVRKKYKLLVALLLIPLCSLLVAPLSFWMQDNGRFWLWKIALNWWYDQSIGTIIFGTGLSTLRIFLPLIQMGAGTDITQGPWFFWLHNDWLQILFEQGVVGLISALIFLNYVLCNSFLRHKRVFVAGLGFCFCMCTNFPMHWPIQAFLGFTLARYALYD